MAGGGPAAGARGTGGVLGLGATGEALERELGPAEWSARVVGAGADGVGPAVLLEARARPPGGTRAARPLAQYLLGCPEGFARMALEHRARPGGGLRTVVLPSLTPVRAGGLAGLLLRLSSDGHAGVRVLGPPGCPAHVLALRHVARWAHPRTEVDAFAPPTEGDPTLPGYEDGLVAVTPTVLHCSGSGTAGGREAGDPHARPRKQQRRDDDANVASAGHGRELAAGSWLRPHDDVPVYLRSGALADPPKGGKAWACPLVWLELKSLGGAVAMVDCSDAGDVAEIRSYVAARGQKMKVLAVFHWSAPEVVSLPAYEAMCEELLGPGTGGPSDGRNFMLRSMTADRVAFLASRRVSVKLNMVSKDLFPLPFHSREQREEGAVTAGGVVAEMELLRSGPGPANLAADGKAGTEPERPVWEGLEELRSRLREGIPDLEQNCRGVQAALAECAQAGPSGFPERSFAAAPGSNASAAEALRASLTGKTGGNGPALTVGSPHGGPLAAESGGTEQDAGAHEPEVVFLGTGCAEPSKYRSGSGIIFRCGGGFLGPSSITPAANVLVEAGEGVVGQMVRQFGEVGARREIGALACVWVSHRHADHCTGLPGVIAAWRAARAGPRPLLIIGPWPVRDWLRDMGLLDDVCAVHFVHCKHFNQPGCPARRDLFCQTGLVEWNSVRVQHCYDSYGLVFGHRQGWRVVFSGDCRPCQELVRAGFRCTLLIHEATFEDSLESQAHRKRHSTSSEAAATSQQMQAHRTIFTHFSQRYPRAPRDVPREGPLAARPIVAFDGMRIPFRLLGAAPLLLPGVDYVLEAPGADTEGR